MAPVARGLAPPLAPISGGGLRYWCDGGGDGEINGRERKGIGSWGGAVRGKGIDRGGSEEGVGSGPTVEMRCGVSAH